MGVLKKEVGYFFCKGVGNFFWGCGRKCRKVGWLFSGALGVNLVEDTFVTSGAKLKNYDTHCSKFTEKI